jgi:hypothetical protein
VPARIPGASGLLVFVTFNVAWIAGGLAQPSAYSVANDDISDLGAMTATSPWIYNQVGANPTGVLVVLLGLGLWRALSPDVIGRIGADVLIAEAPRLFRRHLHLDCQESMRRATTSPGTHAPTDRVGLHRSALAPCTADSCVRIPPEPRLAGIFARPLPHRSVKPAFAARSPHAVLPMTAGCLGVADLSGF